MIIFNIILLCVVVAELIILLVVVVVVVGAGLSSRIMVVCVCYMYINMIEGGMIQEG